MWPSKLSIWGFGENSQARLAEHKDVRMQTDKPFNEHFVVHVDSGLRTAVL